MDDPFYHMSRTIESDIERIERRMEHAMGQLQAQDGDMFEKQQYTREWRDETPQTKTYFSESITIMRPGYGHEGTRSSAERGHGMGHSLGLLVASLAAITWYHGAKRFLEVYRYTTFSEEHKWKVVFLWPFLLLTSPKFRKEWESASARSKTETSAVVPVDGSGTRSTRSAIGDDTSY